MSTEQSRPASATPAQNTRRAYAADWAHFARWCRLQGIDPLPAAPESIACYLEALATAEGTSPALSVVTIERRLAGLIWNYAQRGFVLDRKAAPLAATLAALRRRPVRAPHQKAAIRPEEIEAMVATLPYDLRGLRDRAILLLGHAGGLRRSEIVGLDLAKGTTPEAGGWIDIQTQGALLTLRTKTGRREVAIPRGEPEHTCPVHALEQWLHYARIDQGPVFVRITRDGKRALGTRLSDRHVARLVKMTVLKSGLRADLPEAERLALFSGASLRASRAS